MSVTAALARFAAEMPDEIAVVVGDDRISWARLNHLVDRAALWLSSGRPRGGVALSLANGPALVVLILAAARSGREAQIMDPAWPLSLARAVLSEMESAILLSEAEIDGISATPLFLITPGLTFSGLEALFVDQTGDNRLPEPDAGLPFYVGFTSGSTGVPKGIRRDHRSWLESFAADTAEFAITNDDVILALGTLTHSLCLYALIRGLNAGARVILCRSFQTTAVLRAIGRESVSVIYGVPTQFRLVGEAVTLHGAMAAPSVRLVLSSGSKLRVDDIQGLRHAFPNAEIAEFYGASELSFVARAKHGDDVPATSVGRPFAGVSVTIRQPDGSHAAPGCPGLICVRSPMVFQDYACGAERVKRFEDDMTIGDVGYLDPSGYLHLVGRADRMILSGGRNVYPEEIESVLQAHPAIGAAAVFGPQDAKRDARLAALLRLDLPGQLDFGSLRVYMRDHLPRYKVPHAVGVINDWPLTRSGKTDYLAINKIWEARTFIPLK